MATGVYTRTKEHLIELRKRCFQIGHFVSEETRKKQSFSRKGQKPSEKAIVASRERLTLNNPMLNKEARKKISKALTGHTVSKETREKISKKLRGTRTGKENHSWKGGITPENLKIRASVEYRLWRESVFARDCWICQDCGDDKGGNLNAHHIKEFSSYPELRTSIENGITLCDKCHIKRHKIWK